MNPVVLITGAKGGLGTFVTQAFLAAGARVAGVSRSIQASDFVHSGFAAFPSDLATAAENEALVQRVHAAYGRIDAVVHLVGAYAGGKPVEHTSADEWERMFDLNFRSAHYLFRASIPLMRAQQHGRLLAMGSRAAMEPAPESALYAASKAALVSLVRSIAAENKAQGITANVVLPGTMDTPANRAASPNADFSRWVDPRQVADLLVHLTRSSHLTGAAIPILGGEL
jgi:NAD(P)-dependent dehydrogenase (short-subunit alcohol dehydrogenase family)